MPQQNNAQDTVFIRGNPTDIISVLYINPSISIMKTQESQVLLHSAALGNNPANTKNTLCYLSKSATEIQEWIVSYLAKLLEVEPDELDVKIPFDRYGLDSSAAIGMTGELENWLGCPIDPTLIYDYPTIESFAQHLTEGV